MSEEATACSTTFFPLVSAFAKMWYWLLRVVVDHLQMSEPRISGYDTGSTHLKKTGKVSIYPRPAFEMPDMTTGLLNDFSEESRAVKT